MQSAKSIVVNHHFPQQPTIANATNTSCFLPPRLGLATSASTFSPCGRGCGSGPLALAGSRAAEADFSS